MICQRALSSSLPCVVAMRVVAIRVVTQVVATLALRVQARRSLQAAIPRLAVLPLRGVQPTPAMLEQVVLAQAVQVLVVELVVELVVRMLVLGARAQRGPAH